MRGRAANGETPFQFHLVKITLCSKGRSGLLEGNHMDGAPYEMTAIIGWTSMGTKETMSMHPTAYPTTDRTIHRQTYRAPSIDDRKIMLEVTERRGYAG